MKKPTLRLSPPWVPETKKPTLQLSPPWVPEIKKPTLQLSPPWVFFNQTVCRGFRSPATCHPTGNTFRHPVNAFCGPSTVSICESRLNQPCGLLPIIVRTGALSLFFTYRQFETMRA
jgi:hypothetical protein